MNECIAGQDRRIRTGVYAYFTWWVVGGSGGS
jgi:hypothetical protein